jgi:hypothetical protein
MKVEEVKCVVKILCGNHVLSFTELNVDFLPMITKLGRDSSACLKR